jgi:site-specific DNA recombinase
MSVPKFFKTEFDALATNDAIGHPGGEIAYGYLRVSSAAQAEEGCSGLPRQIMNVHEAALKHGLKIPWECLYADDDSGFDFSDRPDLSRLRQEYKSPNRKACAVVIEHLDRLSRNADWHQGFLLDEMKQYGLHAIFWKEFTSRIERAVMGAIAQDGMEQAKQRMAEGNLHKARDGRVTARVPAYGYKLVDSKGREGENAKKDTHYAIREEEAQVVRFIFQKIIEGCSSRRIAIMLEGSFPPPKKFANWEGKMIRLIVNNRVYKGEFVANATRQIKVPTTKDPWSLTDTAGKTLTRKIARPPEEWIIVPVPAIVSTEDWNIANKIMEKNLLMASRHGKHQFLLTGLIKCATCKYTWFGGHKINRKKSKVTGEVREHPANWYACPSKGNRMPVVIQRIGCDQKQIKAEVLENAIWAVIHEVLLHPEILLGALDTEFQGDSNEEIHRQIAFLEEQIRNAKVEDEKLYKAYLAGVFDENEYAERRKAIKTNQQNKAEEIKQLQGTILTEEQYAMRKQEILLACENARKSGLSLEAPFELKRRIIKTIVEKITLNANEGWFELEGVVQGKYCLFTSDNNENGPHNDGPEEETVDFSEIAGNSKDRGSSQLSIGMTQKKSVSLARG